MESEAPLSNNFPPVAPPHTPSRAARISAHVLKWSGIGLVIFIGSLFLGIASGTSAWWVMNWLAVGMFVCAAVGLIAAIVRVCASVFSESNVRLSELLATVLFAGTVTSALLASAQSAKLPRDQTTNLSIAVVLTTFMFSGAGSTWGWSIARRTKTEAGAQRMKLLAAGWLLTFGSICLLWVVLVTIIWLVERGPLPGDIVPYYFGGFLGIPLMIPGVIIERALRRQSANLND